MNVLLLDFLAQSGSKGSDVFQYMLDKFLPVVIMVVVSIAIIAWVSRLVIFFYNRRIHRKEQNPHERKETMGLPKGAMRTFLTLTFTSLAVIAIFGDDKVLSLDDSDKKWILVELGAIITFYFGSKSLESYVDSRAKIKAIEKATTAEEALRIFREEPTTRPLPQPGETVEEAGTDPVPPNNS